MTTPMDCEHCGRTHERCRGHNGEGLPCGKWPVRGAVVCATHGAAAPQVRAKAAERVALAEVEADAAKALAHTALAPLEDPLEALARLAAEAIAMKDALAGRVNALTSIRYTGVSGVEQLRAEVQLYERALDRAAKFVDVLARHDWIGKKLQLEEAQTGQVVAAAAAGLDAAGLSPVQRDAFLGAFMAALGGPPDLTPTTPPSSVPELEGGAV